MPHRGDFPTSRTGEGLFIDLCWQASCGAIKAAWRRIDDNCRVGWDAKLFTLTNKTLKPKEKEGK